MKYSDAESLTAKLVQAYTHKGRYNAEQIAPNATEQQHDHLTHVYVNSALQVFLALTIAEMDEDQAKVISNRIDRHSQI